MTESIKRELAALVPRLRQFAYALCGDRDRGDDLVQTACVKGLSRLQHFEAGTRLDSWMFRIVQNTFLDEIRAQGRRGVQADPECLDRLSDHGAGAGQAEDRIVLARVRQKMGRAAARAKVDRRLGRRPRPLLQRGCRDPGGADRHDHEPPGAGPGPAARGNRLGRRCRRLGRGASGRSPPNGRQFVESGREYEGSSWFDGFRRARS